MLEILKAALFGIVEGITEWLPVSSTGHMILLNEFVSLDMTPEFWKMFLVVIQLGSIMAGGGLYFDKLWPFAGGLRLKPHAVPLWSKIMLACVPAAVIGLLFNKFMEEHFMTAPVVAATLIFYGVMFLVVESYNKRRTPRVREIERLDYKTAFIIGLFQVLSLVPGTSRSGATILGGILFGTSRYVAAEFTFFLAIPVMFGASLLKMVKFGWHYTGSEILILVVGMATAFVVSILSIKFLLRYIKNNDFKAFGWYRIVLGIIVVLYLYFVGDPVQG
mgnify:CR=1 FL=1